MRIFEVVTLVALWGIPAKLITLPSGPQNSDRLSAVFQQVAAGGNIAACGSNPYSTGVMTGIIATVQRSSMASQVIADPIRVCGVHGGAAGDALSDNFR